jgi:hypothetical protein
VVHPLTSCSCCLSSPHPTPPPAHQPTHPNQLERNREKGLDQSSQQARVTVTDEEDQAFLEELAALVEAWLAEGETGGPPQLVLPPANGFRRLLTYQLLDGPRFSGNGHRGFVVVKVRARAGAPDRRSEIGGRG